MRGTFGDDALAYFTERLDLARLRRATGGVVRQAKRNAGFQETRRFGLALDGTGAGRSQAERCAGCRPIRNAQQEIVECHHQVVLVSVVGTAH